MLSRSAQGLYWMGRYLERAGHLCRLLRRQVDALVDRPVDEILFGWGRIYATLGRAPPMGSFDMGSLDAAAGEDYTLADSFTLAGDLTFERANPDSVWNCFSLGRENARQMRHCINTEMWACLNLAYLSLRGLEIEDIWKVSPENFYAETARKIDAFTGVADATMSRDDGWRFLRLGRFIERAQFMTALLQAQLDAARAFGGGNDDSGGEDNETGWVSLLRAYQAFDAYERAHSLEVRPAQALDLLVTDPLLPVSLSHAADVVAAELGAIGAGPGARASAAATRRAGRLIALLRHEWPDRDDREEMLAQAGALCRELHDLVMAAYIDYDVDDSPPA